MNGLITQMKKFKVYLKEKMKQFEDKYGITGEDEVEDHERSFEEQCGHPDHGDLDQVGGSKDAERWTDCRDMRGE